MKIQPTATFPGKMPSKASAPPTHWATRTHDTGTRGVICNKLNAIPHFFPASQFVRGIEVYVSGSEKDSNYKIYTITLNESNN